MITQNLLSLRVATVVLAALSPLALAADPVPSPSPSASPAATKAPSDVRDPNDAAALKPLVGTRVTIEGTVTKATEAKSTTVRYLNFNNNYRSSLSLVFFVNTPSGVEFTMEKLREYEGKKVRVSGILSEHENALQIKVDALSQLEVQP